MARNWSLDQLAAAVGCSKPQISDLERGNRPLSVDWMRRIAPHLGAEVADLLSLKDNPNRPDAWEQSLIDLLRQATPEQRDNIRKVAEALIPSGKHSAAA